jgi:hypothetical protein
MCLEKDVLFGPLRDHHELGLFPQVSSSPISMHWDPVDTPMWIGTPHTSTTHVLTEQMVVDGVSVLCSMLSKH